jgi:hypothetical protein
LPEGHDFLNKYTWEAGKFIFEKALETRKRLEKRWDLRDEEKLHRLIELIENINAVQNFEDLLEIFSKVRTKNTGSLFDFGGDTQKDLGKIETRFKKNLWSVKDLNGIEQDNLNKRLLRLTLEEIRNDILEEKDQSSSLFGGFQKYRQEKRDFRIDLVDKAINTINQSTKILDGNQGYRLTSISKQLAGLEANTKYFDNGRDYVSGLTEKSLSKFKDAMDQVLTWNCNWNQNPQSTSTKSLK